MMTDKNQQTYQAASIVWHYTQLSLLQAAEKTILDRFKAQLPTLKMLDIGIGGGRTTQHFAPLVAEYTGIDYSAAMIAACRQRFANFSHPLTLEVGDARNRRFADNSFDFILFSFNGIDYVSHGDRLQILQEIRRVGKSGCYVFFSSHNLQSMARMFDYKTRMSWNPFQTYVNLVMLALLKLFNPSINRDRLKTASHLTIRDESHNFRLQTYYIRPEAQVKQLESNFNNIEIYSWKTGRKIRDTRNPSVNSDLWLYYFCGVK
ncbi:MAG: class I SAM-dependent methyltransferase [Spirulina sp.]